MKRRLVLVVGALALCLAVSGCDKCGDAVKINFPGATACSDTK
jgi:hypothetical protein